MTCPGGAQGQGDISPAAQKSKVATTRPNESRSDQPKPVDGKTPPKNDSARP